MGCCQKKTKNKIIKNIDDNIREPMMDEKDSQLNINSKDLNINENENVIEKICCDDFIKIKLLGTGSFGKVLLVRLKRNNKLYAMKILNKIFLKKRHQEQHTKTERDLMVSVNSPFIVNIKFAFQDVSNLYIVTEFMQGGDMFFHLHDLGKFSEERAKFYIIELVLALESLHKKNMVYRDLKPENILIDKNGHIKITDFGLSKILENSNDKTYTLCGTPQYLAPEILTKKGYDKNIDWWALGCFLYEMLTGYLPFNIPKDEPLKISLFTKEIKFPKKFDKQAKDFIKKLLIPNPLKRLGSENDSESVKSHPYFKGVNWEKYEKKEVKPPYIPKFSDELDLRYFDKLFTDEDVTSTKTKHKLRTRKASPYQSFTYISDSLKNKDENQNEKEDGNLKEENEYDD